MTPAERQAMRERLVDAEYDLGHSCEEFEYHWGGKRCYSYETGELCRYEPKCHDENREGKHYRIVAQEAILKDLSAALDEIDRLEAENERLKAELKQTECLYQSEHLVAESYLRDFLKLRNRPSPKELTMTVKATELPIVKEYMEGIAAEMQRLEGENERLKELEKNRGSFRWMDMTPTADLPSRILSAYLDYSEWSDNTLGMEPSNPIIVEMNRARHERNALIEQALASLGRPE